MRLKIALLAIVLTGCKPMEATKSLLNLPSSYMESGGSDLIPATDKVSGDCADNKNFDACIYMKNPSAQENKVVAVNDLSTSQRFGVKLRGIGATGYLSNASIAIHTLNTPRLSLVGGLTKKYLFSATDSEVEQLNAYYWANRTVEYVSARVGQERMPLSPLKIYVDDTFTGYAAVKNAIHLEKNASSVPKALSGEAVVQLMGQALAQDLAKRALFPGASAQHKSCGLNPRGCCAAADGCAQALGSAFGDYLAAMMFPGSPRLGESISGSLAGQTVCTVPRDLASLANRTKADVYAACANATGNATLMGSWYASLWWKLRIQAESQGAGGAADIDRIFFDHARQWNSASTFAEAKASALSVAQSYKSGKYTALVTSALTSL